MVFKIAWRSCIFLIYAYKFTSFRLFPTALCCFSVEILHISAYFQY